MSDAASSATPEAIPDAAAARAAEQARLRKERREAKIKAGGSARLNRITGVGGGLQRDPEPLSSDKPEVAASAASTAASSEQRATSHAHADPGEVDISGDDWDQLGAAQARRPNQQRTSATPPVDPLNMSEAQIQQMMMGFDRQLPGGPAGGNPFLGGEGPGAEDPMMKMLSQMMGASGQGPSLFGVPPNGAAPGQPQTVLSATSTRYTAIWRILHTILALGLSLYLVLTTSFSGTKLEPERAAVGTMNDSSQASRSFFLIFATTEALLLTTRFFLDRGREPPSGILWTVTGLLPSPFKNYLETALRYGQMFTTFRADLLVCIFVLGLYSWIRTS